MSEVLNKAVVLVLNRNWQALHVRTPAEAFCQMATGAATALEIEGEEYIRPVTWAEWITLPVREQDQSVRTARGAIRVPTVVVAVCVEVAQAHAITASSSLDALGMTPSRVVIPDADTCIHRALQGEIGTLPARLNQAHTRSRDGSHEGRRRQPRTRH